MDNSTPQTPETQEERRKSLGWGAWVAIAGVALLLIILALGLRRTNQGPVKIGDTVPNFTLTTFDGEVYELANQRGKVVVINFWASWCKPCEQEAADLERAWQIYQPGGEVVFLGVDYVDTEPEAMGYLNKFNISFPNGPDLGTRISQGFRILGVPETYIIDRNGVLRHVKKGPYTSLAEIQAAIEPLLTP